MANFWCASNVVVKWRAWAAPARLVQLSTALTALGFLPGVVGLLRAGLASGTAGPAPRHVPFLPLLPYALLTSSLSFFLFSFQVHEKTILLPLLPMTLLLSAAPADSAVHAWGVLVNNVAVFRWALVLVAGIVADFVACY